MLNATPAVEPRAAVAGPGTGSPGPIPVAPIFAGLLVGMFLGSLNMTLVAPALPTIVAQLGGIEYYSWVPVAALVASAVVTPIVGKLSDIYGRKPFYMGGIAVFMVGSALCGLAPSFWFLVGARAVQGIGMGAMMPLSQAIIGDIISPRDRGKYQGVMGANLGLASILGPLVGGYITEHLTWRWLFFVNLPVAVVAIIGVGLFLKARQVKRPHVIDYAGIVTLSLSVVSILLATMWGGHQYSWTSAQVAGLYVFGALMLAVFLWIEGRASEPILPLRLWKNSIFTFSNLAVMFVAMSMIGLIYFLPLFLGGVIGNSVTNTGSLLAPMLLAMVVTSIISGALISGTGHYKLLVLAGLAVLGVGFFLLTQMNEHTDNRTVIRNMVVLGLGLGATMQTFVLIVQNAVGWADLGVATSTLQLFRSIGSAVGPAVMGTILTYSLTGAIARHLPPWALTALKTSGNHAGDNVGSLLDPSAVQQLPPVIAAGIRAGLSDALHPVFIVGLCFVVAAFAFTLLIKEIPLRRTVHVRSRETADDAVAARSERTGS